MSAPLPKKVKVATKIAEKKPATESAVAVKKDPAVKKPVAKKVKNTTTKTA